MQRRFLPTQIYMRLQHKVWDYAGIRVGNPLLISFLILKADMRRIDGNPAVFPEAKMRTVGFRAGRKHNKLI